MQQRDTYQGNPLKVNQEAFIPAAQQQDQQNQQNQQQSGIGSKDLTMIEDMLNHEAMVYKKCTVFSGYFTDEKLVGMAQAAAAHHKQHFEALQDYMSRQN